MLLFYITDRSQFTGNEPARLRQVLDKIFEAACAGVDFIQLREKDLTTCDLEILAREAVSRVKAGSRERRTKLLINSRADVAIAVGADGVHLRSNDVSPAVAREICQRDAGSAAVVAVSCHSSAEVAAAEGADFAVFGPVFEKGKTPPAGLDGLQRACQAKLPVLALGGVTLANARACLDAGAAGIAGIRLFQGNDLSQLISKLRGL